MVTFDLLNDHELDFDNRCLTLTLKFPMHKSTIEENYDNQRKLFFEKHKFDIFIKGFK
jgi:hypothetical protein